MRFHCTSLITIKYNVQLEKKCPSIQVVMDSKATIKYFILFYIILYHSVRTCTIHICLSKILLTHCPIICFASPNTLPYCMQVIEVTLFVLSQLMVGVVNTTFNLTSTQIVDDYVDNNAQIISMKFEKRADLTVSL